MVEPNETTPQAAEAPPSEPERFSIDFPPELAVETEAPAEEPTATETVPDDARPVPAKMVPKAALDQERDKRKKARGLYEAAEAARVKTAEENARLRREQAKQAEAAQTPVDYSSMADLNEAFKTFEERLLGRVQNVRASVEGTTLRTKVALSETFYRSIHEDYDEVLDKSGVAQAIQVNPATGHPNDPFLFNAIYGADNPAAFAYDYAKGKLAPEAEDAAEARGVERGRQETVQTIVKNVGKPRGIHGLSTSSAAKVGGYTFEDIDRMSDAQKQHIMAKHPDLWERYLMAVPAPPRR